MNPLTRAGVWIATSFGAGYAPVAPGTVGSAVGVGVFLALRGIAPELQLLVIAAISLVGVWAGTVAARHFNREDPGQVVIDEVAGQLVTLVLVPGLGWRGIVAGFLLFRILDIVKPFPANRLERLPGGWGIMADDLMAGVYGNLMLQAIVYWIPWLR